MENNIYAAPEANVVDKNLDSNKLVLAGRGKRLGAAIIDSIISLLLVLPSMYFSGFFKKAMQGIQPGLVELFIWTVVGWILFVIIHGYLLKNYGQTIGKKLVGIKIVTTKGEVPAFVPMLVKRYFVLGIVGPIPVLGRLVPIIDVLFIFKADKRCIHDLIADTKVVDA